MKRLWLLALAVLTAGCLAPVQPPKPPTPPPAPITYVFGVVVCDGAATPTGCPVRVAGATVQVDTTAGYVSLTADANGYVLATSTIPFSDLKISATGFNDLAVNIQPPQIAGTNLFLALQSTIPPIPPPPTRAEMLNLHITFQGLTVPTAQFGTLPWFEAALPWMTPADRASAYEAKRTSQAWPGGDTHAIISLPSGPPLYDEAGQPYSADRFPALDWTAGGTAVDGRLADLVAELARAGFPRQLLFLGGDDGSTCGQVPPPAQCGFVIAMHQLGLVHAAIRGSKYGDLGPYVIILPGWDGVFYGYTPDQVAQWGVHCRELFLYCGLEHQPGKIPVGEGGGDYLPGGRMSVFDLILAEFAGPNTSAWRQTPNTSAVDYNGNQIWQIAARMLGPAYHRPPDQPANADEPNPPFYLAPASPRGPFVHCAFEWVGEYLFVRGQETPAQVSADRRYFQALGYGCGG